MFCSNELSFFIQVLQKSAIPYQEFALPITEELEIDNGLRRQLGVTPSVFEGCRALFQNMEPGAIYHVTDCFYLHYLFFLLPGSPRCMKIGPFLSMRPLERQIFEMAEQYDLSPTRIHLLEEFYPTLPQIADNSSFYAMVYCLCETLYGHRVEVRPISLDHALSSTALSSVPEDTDLTTIMRRLENRYRLEDELLQSVADGDRVRLHQLLNSTNMNVVVEPRLSDPVRNIKNYCIVLNTALRKAAQYGGVHPIYLDDLSRTFAARIEQLPTTTAAQQLINEMSDQYCLLVQRYSATGCSLPVQTAMLYVRQHLAEPLNLRTIAAMLNCNPSYFSARFKKETGQTLTTFILQERMRLAANLLLTTRLQIQTIAQYCGFLDVNYFSRVFHQAMGNSPSEYRKTGRSLHVS